MCGGAIFRTPAIFAACRRCRAPQSGVVFLPRPYADSIFDYLCHFD